MKEGWNNCRHDKEVKWVESSDRWEEISGPERMENEKSVVKRYNAENLLPDGWCEKIMYKKDVIMCGNAGEEVKWVESLGRGRI